jgi:hypothetical protein
VNRERPAGNGIQVKPVLPTCLEEMRSDHGDHRRVVGAENGRGNENLDSRKGGIGVETLP